MADETRGSVDIPQAITGTARTTSADFAERGGLPLGAKPAVARFDPSGSGVPQLVRPPGTTVITPLPTAATADYDARWRRDVRVTVNSQGQVAVTPTAAPDGRQVGEGGGLPPQQP